MKRKCGTRGLGTKRYILEVLKLPRYGVRIICIHAPGCVLQSTADKVGPGRKASQVDDALDPDLRDGDGTT